jgi:hypothetical protein
MRKIKAALTFALAVALQGVPAAAAESGDQAAIAKLLATYTDAVSHKNQALFETLLLGKDIPFAYVPPSPTKEIAPAWRNYETFRRGVFEGAPFIQTFRDVHVRVHGAIADVDLIYVNTDAEGAKPGWKTMQLIRVNGAWKIASEFFTSLPDGGR